MYPNFCNLSSLYHAETTSTMATTKGEAIMNVWEGVNEMMIVKSKMDYWMKPMNPHSIKGLFKQLWRKQIEPEQAIVKLCTWFWWEVKCTDPDYWLQVTEEETGRYFAFVGWKFKLDKDFNTTPIVDSAPRKKAKTF